MDFRKIPERDAMRLLLKLLIAYDKKKKAQAIQKPKLSLVLGGKEHR